MFRALKSKIGYTFFRSGLTSGTNSKHYRRYRGNNAPRRLTHVFIIEFLDHQGLANYRRWFINASLSCTHHRELCRERAPSSRLRCPTLQKKSKRESGSNGMCCPPATCGIRGTQCRVWFEGLSSARRSFLRPRHRAACMDKRLHEQ